MCYWRRLSKRSVNEFDYEYTANNSLAKLDNDEPQPVISDSLNLFKALQVNQESEPRKSKRESREIYEQDDETALICYRHAEVFIFLTTIASLLLLFITIAVTCWLRIRKITRCQFEHNRLATSSSLSPSLLSLSDAISRTGSLISNAAAVASTGSPLSFTTKTCQAPGWHFQPQPTLIHHHNQHQPPKPMHMHRQSGLVTLFQTRPQGCPSQISR